MRKALVVSKIQIGFRAIVGDENFTMLEGRHRARIDIDIRVELNQRDPQPACFEQRSNRRGRQTFAQT